VKLPSGRVEPFLRHPDPDIHAVLLYGPDAGLVRERAEVLGRSISPDLHDPFRVADITGAALAADPARLHDEAAQISLMGGRRLVRVREPADAQSGVFARFLAAPLGDALIVVEAGDLPARSTLRRAFEEAAAGVAIACYPDGVRELGTVIRDSLGAHNIVASRDALQFLTGHLGGDRLLTRSELEKLALYAGDGGRVELDDARMSIADSAALSLDDAVLSAAEGDAAALDRALTRVFQEGASEVAVVRAMLRHLQRLHLLCVRVRAGEPVEAALRNARPPIFFKQQDSYRRQLGLWREPALRQQLERLAAAEIRLKTTGIPTGSVCREALLAVARSAVQSGRSSASSRSS
jgi:DNA polymerase-3 subunit delta